MAPQVIGIACGAFESYLLPKDKQLLHWGINDVFGEKPFPGMQDAMIAQHRPSQILLRPFPTICVIPGLVLLNLEKVEMPRLAEAFSTTQNSRF